MTAVPSAFCAPGPSPTLFQTPGFGETVDFDHIKRHSYGTHAAINPSGIVPAGPDLRGWTMAVGER